MRFSITQLKEMKRRGEKIPMLTAYDYPTARIVDAAGVPLILVGDSLGMVVLGYDSTIPVTMDVMVHHTAAVSRGAKNALVIADMPFMSYQISIEQTMHNAARLMQEGGAQAVKLEGGVTVADTVRRIVDCGIPVMGHIGLTPQSIHQFGGFKAQGKTLATAAKLIDDAIALEQAGAFAVVVETVPAELSEMMCRKVSIPVIGIGAGAGCDGQVQVISDMFGLYTDFIPRHAKRYAQLADIMTEAISHYVNEVKSGAFPTAKESLSMDKDILTKLESLSCE
ncbi:MAG: 3-methyl-2-oxobutanoate hydroxymethyltransferase [Dehalococcoidia bacterium]|nr:3-methyl-2-oxobutanoate hydroxymethyltransferase [Dehalococcoidia bacterium]